MEAIPTYTDDSVRFLRESVKEKMSARRFAHTLAVVEEIRAIGRFYMPQALSALTVAALLHDITKEWSAEEQLRYCEARGIAYLPEAKDSPSVLHAMTAPALVEERFSDYADPMIRSAIMRHTVGAPDMTVFEMLLFIADFTEPTRRWEGCRLLHREFTEALPDIPPQKRKEHLEMAVFSSLKMTLRALTESDAIIYPDTVKTYNAFAKRISG